MGTECLPSCVEAIIVFNTVVCVRVARERPAIYMMKDGETPHILQVSGRSQRVQPAPETAGHLTACPQAVCQEAPACVMLGSLDQAEVRAVPEKAQRLRAVLSASATRGTRGQMTANALFVLQARTGQTDSCRVRAAPRTAQRPAGCPPAALLQALASAMRGILV